MKRLNFKKIDAFTDGRSPGNPAGYIMLEDKVSLTEAEMLKVAQELKGFVNEVGYVKKMGGAFDLRFYSSECEVPFCGHATIAIMYDLLKNNNELIQEKEVFINVAAGKLSVYSYINEEDAVYIMAPQAEFLECNLGDLQIATAIKMRISDIDCSRPIRLIDGGLKTLLVPVKSLTTCLSLFPDQEELKLFCLENNIDIVHVSTSETSTPDCKYRTRVFAPKFGYLEDPATGSGNAAFGYYLNDEGLWTGDMTIEQGPDRTNPNFIKLKKLRCDKLTNMIFGGSGTTRIEGNYYLHSSN